MSSSTRTRLSGGAIAAGLIVVVALVLLALALARGVDPIGAVNGLVGSMFPPRAVRSL